MAIASAYFSSNANVSVATNTSGSSSSSAVVSTSSAPVNGTAAGQLDQSFYPANATATTTPLVYDIVGGGLLQQDGVSAVAIAKLCKLKVVCRATSGTATVTIGGGTNPIIPAITVSAFNGSVDIEDLVNGIAITGGSNDKLTITASAGSVPIEVLIAGRSV